MFRSNFWESDFVSQTGFDTLVNRMKEGRQTCRDLEEFVKARAKAEEEYAKTLLKIAKVDRCAGETGTLKNSIDVLRREAESEAGFHLTHAQHLTEEANKLADFREKQREERRRHEEAMHRVHKTKADGFRRLQSCKSGYESKFRAAEKAESDFQRVKFSAKTKEIDKARKNSQQCKQASDKADEEYQNAVAQLEMIRQSWEQEHKNTCDILQRLEEERLAYLRNALWVYSNLGSDLFVKSDDSRETMRLSLEICDPQSDIMDFVSRKATGSDPLPPITYIKCNGSPGSQNAVNNISINTVGRSPAQENHAATYAAIDLKGVGQTGTYRAMYAYTPRTSQEIELQPEDRVFVIEQGIDGWWTGKNNRTGQQGLFPANYVQL